MSWTTQPLTCNLLHNYQWMVREWEQGWPLATSDKCLKLNFSYHLSVSNFKIVLVKVNKYCIQDIGIFRITYPGEFGVVYRGQLSAGWAGRKSTKLVAVKTLKGTKRGILCTCRYDVSGSISVRFTCRLSVLVHLHGAIWAVSKPSPLWNVQSAIWAN